MLIVRGSEWLIMAASSGKRKEREDNSITKRKGQKSAEEARPNPALKKQQRGEGKIVAVCLDVRGTKSC